MLFYKREKMDPSQRKILKQQFQQSAQTALPKSGTKKPDAGDLGVGPFKSRLVPDLG